MDNFDPYNVLLAIDTVLLMTGFVLQGHKWVIRKRLSQRAWPTFASSPKIARILMSSNENATGLKICIAKQHGWPLVEASLATFQPQRTLLFTCVWNGRQEEMERRELLHFKTQRWKQLRLTKTPGASVPLLIERSYICLRCRHRAGLMRQ